MINILLISITIVLGSMPMAWVLFKLWRLKTMTSHSMGDLLEAQLVIYKARQERKDKEKEEKERKKKLSKLA